MLQNTLMNKKRVAMVYNDDYDKFFKKNCILDQNKAGVKFNESAPWADLFSKCPSLFVCLSPL